MSYSFFDIVIDGKIVYQRIPEHSLGMFMKKAQRKHKKRAVAQMRIFEEIKL